MKASTSLTDTLLNTDMLAKSIQSNSKLERCQFMESTSFMWSPVAGNALCFSDNLATAARQDLCTATMVLSTLGKCKGRLGKNLSVVADELFATQKEAKHLLNHLSVPRGQQSRGHLVWRSSHAVAESTNVRPRQSLLLYRLSRA